MMNGEFMDVYDRKKDSVRVAVNIHDFKFTLKSE